MICFIDLETRSDIDLRKVGARAYGAHPQTKMLLVSWALDGGPVKTWKPLEEALPDGLMLAISNPKVIFCAHNALFERCVLREYFPELGSTTRWMDTMALAQAHGLPASLDALCGALKVPGELAKSREGTRLIKIFCVKGRKPANTEKLRQDWLKFIDYNRRDVEAMRACFLAMPTDNRTQAERRLWILDQEINDRGIPIDAERVEMLNRKAAEEVERLNQWCLDQHGFKLSQVAKLKEWVEARENIKIAGVDSKTIKNLLTHEGLSPTTKEILEMRQLSALTSIGKMQKVVETAINGRVHDAFVFCGAAKTGRWSGRGLQPQNLPRASRKAEEIEEALAHGEFDLKLAKDALRSVICGSELISACDLSAIEVRVAAWLSYDHIKVEDFIAFDRGEGSDIYKLCYSKMFGGRAEDVTSEQRTIGKICELGLGYGGGPVAIADSFRGNTKLANLILNKASGSERAMAVKRHAGAKTDINPTIYKASEVLKARWRKANPHITKSWEDCEEAFDRALKGQSTVACRCVFDKLDNHVRIALPSGRCLYYYNAQFKHGEYTCDGAVGIGSWGRVKVYGGKLFENLCQAIARDQLASGLKNCAEAGMKIFLHVHDEIVVSTSEPVHEEMARLMCQKNRWNEGLPLAAAGYTAKRYKKD